MQTARTATTKTTFAGAAVAIVASLAGTAAVAQDAADEAPREYNVEVIVFVYEEDVSVGNEIFLPEPPPGFPSAGLEDDSADASPGIDDWQGMTDPADGQPAEPVADERLEAPGVASLRADGDYLPDVIITPVDELGMTDIAAKLERLDVYTPILHAAWTQRALPRTQSTVMDLEMLTDPPPNLNGRFQLYLSRFLHLDVDLTLDNGDKAPIAVDVPGRSLFLSDEPARQPGVVHYRIKDDRIFKNGETRYFDHPRFGVIARVTRVEPPEEDDAESADAEALDGGTGNEFIE